MTQGARLKGLVLSGGTGSRLRPFTYSTAKQLLPLANKPVIFYVIESLVQAGIREIGVVVGGAAEQIQGALGDGSSFGAELTYIYQAAPRGLAHAVQTAEPFLGEDPFVVFLGDNLLRGGIAGHVEAFMASTAEAQILVKRVANPGEFGIADLDGNGHVRRLVEKPLQPPSDLAILGVYMLRRRFFEAAQTIEPSRRGELEITDAMQAMIDSGIEVCARVVSEDWIDTGSPADLLLANRMLLGEERVDYARHESSSPDGLVQVAPGARLSGSLVTGPAIIGCNAEIIDSRVGPDTSIGDCCRIRDARVEGSIVMDGGVIEGVALRDCIVGKNAVIKAATSGQVLEGLLVGDDGRVELR